MVGGGEGRGAERVEGMVMRTRTLAIVLGVACCTWAWGFRVELEPPGEREFILDHGQLIAAEDEERIRGLCDKLLSETAIPLVVVTINSMAEHGAPGTRIETFANILFDQWGIGYEQIGGHSWNRGILLLVSRNDRKARIELGADWAHDFDTISGRIMNGHIIPRFKKGEYSGGIVAGVEGLEKMARGIKVPSGMLTFGNGEPLEWWHYAIVLGGIGLVIFTVISLIRRGAGGWAWVFWGVLFAVIGAILFQMLRSGARGGGGFGGGSFGGGFSGGGGATGSW